MQTSTPSLQVMTLCCSSSSPGPGAEESVSCVIMLWYTQDFSSFLVN